jgi:hypothetical protein
MTVLELAERLRAIWEENGDIPVMFTDPNKGSTFEVFTVRHRVAEEDQYPEEWNMPAGFEFIDISQ